MTGTEKDIAGVEYEEVFAAATSGKTAANKPVILYWQQHTNDNEAGDAYRLNHLIHPFVVFQFHETRGIHYENKANKAASAGL